MSKHVKELYRLIKFLFENPWKFNVELDSDDSIPMTLLLNRISEFIKYDEAYIRNFVYENEDFEVFEEGDREFVKFNG